MEIRRSLLASTVSLALFFTLLACLASGLSVKSRERSHPVSAAQTVAEAAVAGTEEQGYLIRTVADEVCIFQGDTLVLHTGVTASLLPRQDREALEQGISVNSQAELTALLEDLGS